MGRNLDDLRRLRERIAATQIPPEQAQAERVRLKGRILGTLLLDARLTAGRSVVDSAMMLGITKQQYEAFEAGEETPSLPQLEILAYYYNVPLSHFWTGETRAVERAEASIHKRAADMLMLRQRMVGVRLRQLREQAGLSLEEVAAQVGLPADEVQAIENGAVSPPINTLETLVQAVRGSLDDLTDRHGPVGNWLKAQDEFEAFASLPPQMREFILRPINRAYLELAMQLADMDVTRLRTIAESILDITL